MKTIILTVFDSAAARFLTPFNAETLETAIRSFRAVVNEPGHQFNKYPEDYVLFAVGEFNQETGMVEAYTEPRSLGVAITYMDRTATTPTLVAPESNGVQEEHHA